MTLDDRQKWNNKWSVREFDECHRSTIVDLVATNADLPGRLLDVAGGGSPTSTNLARLGFDVTVLDVSDVGLEMARDTAAEAGVEITTIEIDLDNEPLPEGPWDVITTANFLKRELFPAMIDSLAPGGLIIVTVATVTNLERHQRPGPPFLAQPDELVQLSADLEIVHHSEAWRSNDRHEAHLVARKL